MSHISTYDENDVFVALTIEKKENITEQKVNCSVKRDPEKVSRVVEHNSRC